MAGSFRGSACPVWTAAEMDRTMREIVDGLYTFAQEHRRGGALAVLRDHRRNETSQWDRPREGRGLKKQLEVVASGIVEAGGRPGTTDGAVKG